MSMAKMMTPMMNSRVFISTDHVYQPNTADTQKRSQIRKFQQTRINPLFKPESDEKQAGKDRAQERDVDRDFPCLAVPSVNGDTDQSVTSEGDKRLEVGTAGIVLKKRADEE
jgi:hypothetical protein